MTSPSIYVGTYAAYNNGSLKGKWFDLEDYADADDFYKAIKAFHCNPDNDDSRTEPEDDPEFMFQDWEGIPDSMIGECWLHPDLWDEWIALDDDEREMVEAYSEHVGEFTDLDTVRGAFQGRYASEADWAEEYWESCGMLADVPENLRYYINYAAFARDCQLNGDIRFVPHNGDVWVFYND